MQTHYLKTWPEFYKEILSGNKTFEIRKNDRKFAAGDTLVLQEWDPILVDRDNPSSGYTGNDIRRRVDYVLTSDKSAGLIAGYCVMTISLL